MWTFNPVIDSLRELQQANNLNEIQKKSGVSRSSLGSPSASVTIVDPEPLTQIAATLVTQIPNGDPSRFDQIGHQLTAVDGSVFKTAVRVASLSWLPSKSSSSWRGVNSYRIHTHFEILWGVPKRIDATPARPKGKGDEKSVLVGVLKPDRRYVTDRGHAKFELFNQISAIGSSYLCRPRDNSTPKFLSPRPLSDADRSAGIESNTEVVLGTNTLNRKTQTTDHRVRYIVVKTPPHARTDTEGNNSDGYLRLVTDVTKLTDVTAELIAEAYRLRWLIELFFRMIKQLLGCRHLLSTKHGGVGIQMYLAIIDCLLILIHTGSQPTKRTCVMICF